MTPPASEWEGARLSPTCPMSRRHLALVLHGKAAGRPEVRAAVESVRADGHRVDVRVTWEAGDAVRFAKAAAAEGVDTVVAGGGDGSLNEVVSGVVEHHVENIHPRGRIEHGLADECLGELVLGRAR